MSKKSVAIVQSCYIPWKGYLDLVNSVDEFILYDDRQFTKRDWRNRNRIKADRGAKWLTIPVLTKGLYHQRIDQTLISEPDWGKRHWKAIVHSYASAPYFRAYRDLFEELYLGVTQRHLSRVNRRFLEAICEVLGVKTTLSWSTDYSVEGERTERLVALCRAAQASVYLSGPRARDYLDEDLFGRHEIELRYFDYSGYPEYEQLHPPFDHAVTILDLLFSTGPRAPCHMKSFADAVIPVGA
jgi:WbqC-like protein family